MDTDSQPSLFRSARFWVPAIVCLAATLAVPVAFIAGAIVGNTQVYNNLSSEQRSRIESFLRENPESFGHLTVEDASNGWAYPVGKVASQTDYDRLAEELHDMFGDRLSEDMMRAVEVD